MLAEQQKAEAELATMVEIYQASPTENTMKTIALHMYYAGWDAGIAAGRAQTIKADESQQQQDLVAKAINDDIQSQFEQFWEQYKKKVGKDLCFKVFKSLSLRDRRDILAYVPLYVRCCPDKKYRKNPLTFLRQKAWKDELIPSEYERNLKNARLNEARGVADFLRGVK